MERSLYLEEETFVLIKRSLRFDQTKHLCMFVFTNRILYVVLSQPWENLFFRIIWYNLESSCISHLPFFSNVETQVHTCLRVH